MSNNLGEFGSFDWQSSRSSDMSVTAFVGGKHGRCIQITIAGWYCALAENQVRRLATMLQKRLKGSSGYQATDADLGERVEPEVVE